MKRSTLSTALAVAVSLGIAACGDDPIAPIGDTALLSVVPTGGATDVDPNAPVTLQFEHAMHMDMYVALHAGAGVDGPLVDGDWEWSADMTNLTFTHAMPLDAMADYTIHIGGGMMDADGHLIDLEQHGHDMGGEWVTQQMMDHRMMGSGSMMGGDDMVGDGWVHSNGSFGMIFSFTTR
jgi:hypothetical protein